MLVLKFFEGCIKVNHTRESAVEYLKQETRLDVLVEFLMEKFESLEIEYKIAALYSLGVLMSAYEYELAREEYFSRIVQCFEADKLP